MRKPNSLGGNAALYVGHMAGAIDLAALPLWVGALMASYHFGADQAGLIVTLFLAGVVAASVVLAPRFNRLRPRWIATGGFAISAICFAVASRLSVSPDSFASLILLHAIAGVGTGSALSMTHGTIGRTANPHRLFGLVNVALGVLAIVMFAALPGMIAHLGGQAIFVAFAITMAFACIVALFLFPEVEITADMAERAAVRARMPIPPIAFLLIGTVVCLTVNQAMVFSFVERIGAAHGFGDGRVQTVLIVMGFVNLLPGALAALLQNRLPPLAVGVAGPLLQAALALLITNATAFPVYAVPAGLYVTLVIFTHTFLFGLLSKVDSSGRAVAATPAMMMTGSAIGPVLGGAIVAGIGFEGLGYAVSVFAILAAGLMIVARRPLTARSAAASEFAGG